MTQSWLHDAAEIERRLMARLQELERLSAESGEARAAVELDQTRVGRLSRMDAFRVRPWHRPPKAVGSRRSAACRRP